MELDRDLEVYCCNSLAVSFTLGAGQVVFSPTARVRNLLLQEIPRPRGLYPN